jgi:hypothetical protein
MAFDIGDAPEEADRQALVGPDSDDPIPFSFNLLARNSRKYMQLIRSGDERDSPVFDASFRRDSVVQFLNLCQDVPPVLTPDNASRSISFAPNGGSTHMFAVK